MMAIVYLGIGSNLGDREANIQRALSLLSENGMHILKQSSLMETAPVGGPPQGNYLNAALKVETALAPEKLLKVLKSIERKLGRKKTVRNGPRPIDIDILLYDNIHINIPTLTIPHPRMRERAFVMNPLTEIEPEIVNQIPT